MDARPKLVKRIRLLRTRGLVLRMSLLELLLFEEPCSVLDGICAKVILAVSLNQFVQNPVLAL